FEHGARNRNPLLLAAAELHPALSYQSSIPVRKAFDEIVAIGCSRRGFHFSLGAQRFRISNVVGNGTRKQNRFLCDRSDVLPKPFGIESTNISSVDTYRSPIDVIEPGEQRGDCRFARS